MKDYENTYTEIALLVFCGLVVLASFCRFMWYLFNVIFL